jgi:C4-dicarboxylate-specific signal transduction histidine kinase
MLAEVANRPIVSDTVTHIGYGSTGGIVVLPEPIAQETARRALRILDGEPAARIPPAGGDFTKPAIRAPPPSPRGTGLPAPHFEVAHLNRAAAAGALSASIAHELNQPLGAILSNAETAELLLRANPLDVGQLKEILADIRQANQRAADIITHLRQLLKKRSEIDLQEFNVNDAIADAIHVLEPEAMQRQVALSVDPAPRPLPVRADPVHLQQVILNLAMNGMDAMASSPPAERKLALQTALNERAEVEVSICDSGPGLPRDKLKEVFETFYTTKQQGTGLGLSIVRTIIETYGGKIWADNAAAGGAVFRFTLPLAELHPA